MRMRYTLVLVGVCLIGPGCTFWRIIDENLRLEPKVCMEEKVMLKRHERLGKLAWDEMVAQYGCEFSDDYRIGFIDGFVDYLTYGGTSADGNGEVPIVPAVPPPAYRTAKAMSPKGLKAAEDWFVGFRHGSNTALASGLRVLAVVPVFDRPNPTLENVPGRFQSLPGRSPDTAGNQSGTPTNPAPAAPEPGEGEPLPPPRAVPPAEPAGKPPMPPAGPAVPPVGPAVPPAVPGVPPAVPGAPPADLPAVPPTGPATPPAVPGTPPG